MTGDMRPPIAPSRDIRPPIAPLRDIRPSVAPPRVGLPMPLAAGLTAVLAGGLFLMLEGRRVAPVRADVAQLAGTPAPPPLALAPDAPAPVAAPVPVVAAHPVWAPPHYPMSRPLPARFTPGMAAPFAMPQPVDEIPPSAPRKSMLRGDAAGAMVYDTTAGPGGQVMGEGVRGHAEAGDETAHAALIHGRGQLIPEGTSLAAVLETPLISDHPGLARAMITADVRGFDGTHVLIPRGSRLVGEFRADAGGGQRRILVTWTRLIRADGVAIRIASPATDPLGGAGIAGRVNSHFGERFAAAVLQSALTVGVNVASEAASSGAMGLWLGGPVGGGAQGLMPSANRAATIKVREGAQIAVLVAHDLDFSGTPAWR